MVIGNRRFQICAVEQSRCKVLQRGFTRVHDAAVGRAATEVNWLKLSATTGLILY